ncbi:MAG TPA: HEAT repeat domain-containing protein [Thermodesulfovibrionales bacterium]|jgi:HEAT repeat protein|nr:HEAT repeat domain-containing protein [Thermodesulfovibrionales bacterium]
MTERFEMKSTIADHMEKGFLENIIDMFKHDRGLYALIGELMTDERMRVRLGISALVETLAKDDPGGIVLAIPGIADLLKDSSPTVRGDAAYLLGIIGHCKAIHYLAEVLCDDSEDVRGIVRESIEEIRQKAGSVRQK